MARKVTATVILERADLDAVREMSAASGLPQSMIMREFIAAGIQARPVDPAIRRAHDRWLEQRKGADGG